MHTQAAAKCKLTKSVLKVVEHYRAFPTTFTHTKNNIQEEILKSDSFCLNIYPKLLFSDHFFYKCKSPTHVVVEAKKGSLNVKDGESAFMYYFVEKS